MKKILFRIFLSVIISILIILILLYTEFYINSTLSLGLPLSFIFSLCPDGGCTGLTLNYFNLFIDFIFWFIISYLIFKRFFLKK